MERSYSAILLMFVGDALSMPVHWYYDPKRDIIRDFGGPITGYQKPKDQHPSSIMHLANTGGHGRGDQQGSIIGDVILHDKKKFWGKRNVHYHQGMSAGDNTLNLLCARVFMRYIARGPVALNEYVSDGGKGYLAEYIKFMTTPGTHNDTYAESYHRDFFKNLSQGVPPELCAGEEGHDTASMGGVVQIPLVAVLFHKNPDEAVRMGLKHLVLTHKSEKLSNYVSLYIRIFCECLNSEKVLDTNSFRTLVFKAIADFQDKVRDDEYRNLDQIQKFVSKAPLDDTRVIGDHFSSACYIEDSMPSLLYLACKYGSDIEKGLLANTNAGGENCHRGACLGALLGAAFGTPSAIPEKLVTGLTKSNEIQKEIRDFLNVAATR